MPVERTYHGRDQIAGTPTRRDPPPNRTIGGLPDVTLTKQTKPTRMRRRGG